MDKTLGQVVIESSSGRQWSSGHTPTQQIYLKTETKFIPIDAIKTPSNTVHGFKIRGNLACKEEIVQTKGERNATNPRV